eukprot:g7147.t1
MTSRRSKESKKAIPEPKKGQNEGPDVKESKDGPPRRTSAKESTSEPRRKPAAKPSSAPVKESTEERKLATKRPADQPRPTPKRSPKPISVHSRSARRSSRRRSSSRRRYQTRRRQSSHSRRRRLSRSRTRGETNNLLQPPGRRRPRLHLRGRKLQKGSPSPPPWRASRRRENTKAEKAKGKDDEKKIEKKKEETRTPEEKKDTKETEVKEAQEACDQELQSKRPAPIRRLNRPMAWRVLRGTASGACQQGSIAWRIAWLLLALAIGNLWPDGPPSKAFARKHVFPVGLRELRQRSWVQRVPVRMRAARCLVSDEDPTGRSFTAGVFFYSSQFAKSLRARDGEVGQKEKMGKGRLMALSLQRVDHSTAVPQDLGMVPDEAAFSAALSGCVKDRQWKLSIQVLRDMLSTGARRRKATFMDALHACQCGGLWQDAIDIIEDTISVALMREQHQE